jgi:hypothetical protein
LEEANELLRAAKFRDVPEDSYRMVLRTYVPHFRASAERLRECIYAPKSVGKLGLAPLDEDSDGE